MQTPSTPLRVVFAVTETGLQAAAGDYFTAIELGTALSTRYGWEVEYRPRDDAWYCLDGVDLLVTMVDEYDLRCVRGATPNLVTVAWARNWFERWCEQPWISGYDLICASSALAARFMSQRVGKLVRVLRTATNFLRFNTLNRPDTSSLDFVFTGSHWNAPRDIEEVLASLPKRFRGAIYGKHWEKLPQLAHLYRGFLPYDQVHEAYQQAAIVIDDANHVTKDWGAANSRVFDSLAAGCLVITNSPSVSQDAFDDLLPVYSDGYHLGQLLTYYLEDEQTRLKLQEQLLRVVLKRHCYQHRAFELGLHLHKLIKVEQTRVFHDTKFRVSQQDGPKNISFGSCSSAQQVLSPSISFIVPLFNHLEQTQAMLSSLLATLPIGLDYEIILIDDASSDATPDWLRSLTQPQIRGLINARNKGYAKTNNRGAKEAQGDILAFLNNDLILKSGWLEPMLKLLLNPSMNAGLVGNVQRRVSDEKIDHSGVELNLKGQFDHLHSLQEGMSWRPVSWVTGACMFIQRKLFKQVDGFDEGYRNGGEDIDLCFKVSQENHAIYVAQDSCIHHHVSLSRRSRSIQDERNSFLLFSKWYHEIKRHLSMAWKNALASQSLWNFSEYFEDGIPTDLAKEPQMRSMQIAELMIQYQQKRWQKILKLVKE